LGPAACASVRDCVRVNANEECSKRYLVVGMDRSDRLA
jgi:hypothetical protein